jgi:hypothetical protein
MQAIADTGMSREGVRPVPMVRPLSGWRLLSPDRVRRKNRSPAHRLRRLFPTRRESGPGTCIGSLRYTARAPHASGRRTRVTAYHNMVYVAVLDAETDRRPGEKAARSGVTVAVGTPVARRPPHRSGRAALPHPALTLGSNGTHQPRVAMADPWRGSPPHDKVPHPRPWDVSSLAPPVQHSPPYETDPPSERA